MWPLVPPPHFGPASLDFHLNRPVISLIQLQNTVISLNSAAYCAPGPLAEIVSPHSPIWLVPEPLLGQPAGDSKLLVDLCSMVCIPYCIWYAYAFFGMATWVGLIIMPSLWWGHYPLVGMHDEIFHFEIFKNFMEILKYFKTPSLKYFMKFLIFIIKWLKTF